MRMRALNREEIQRKKTNTILVSLETFFFMHAKKYSGVSAEGERDHLSKKSSEGIIKTNILNLTKHINAKLFLFLFTRKEKERGRDVNLLIA